MENITIFHREKKMLLVQGLRNVSQKFQPSAVNRKYRKGETEKIDTFDFTCRSGETLNPCISATIYHFEN